MALKSCRECSAKVSTEALTCTRCGAPYPTRQRVGVTARRPDVPWEQSSQRQSTQRPFAIQLGESQRRVLPTWSIALCAVIVAGFLYAYLPGVLHLHNGGISLSPPLESHRATQVGG